MKVVFMGTPDFSVPILKQLINDGYNVVAVVTQPDRPKGRKKELTPPPVKVEAVKHNIPVLQPEKLSKNKEEVAAILKYEPDLIVTAAFGQLLPKELLEAPKYKCINVHASLLPELRGGAPIHYAIVQGKKVTGITIMYMVERLDAGAILSQVEVPILEDDDVGTLHDKLSVAGANLLSKTIPQLINGEITPQEQDEAKATYAYNITREQEKIDWSKSGEEIYNHVRGLRPWPVAYTTYKGKNMKIWQAEKKKMEKAGAPGEIIDISTDSIVVKTGNGICIAITELQPAGKKKMSTAEFLRGLGATMQLHERLGVDDE